MKKLLALALACCALCACEPVDLAKYLAEPGNPNPVYVFPAVDDDEPLAFHLVRRLDYYEKTGQTEQEEEVYVNTPGYSKRLLVIGTVSTEWDKTKTYLPYFDRLAEHFNDTELEFALIFMDFDKAAVAAMPEVQNLQHVRAFYNTQSRCQNKSGLCGYVLEFVSLDSPQINYIAKDKAVLYPNSSFWPAGNDSEQLENAYQSMKKHVQDFLDQQGNR